MITACEIRLALPRDSARIAILSRDFVEQGLGWRWNSARVLDSIRERTTNVAVACEPGQDIPLGFGIMKYRDNEAHLHLLAVHPSRQRQGIGAALVVWLEASALTAGIGVVYVEARAENAQARAFYRKLGYKEFARAAGYYHGAEDAIRLAKDLW